MPVIWKLDEVMKERRITNAALACASGLSISAISRRRCPSMPRLSGDDLLGMLLAIEELSGAPVGLADLIEVVKVIEVKQ